MPTYEYACQACAHEFEEFQSITAKPLRKCPKCGKAKLKRLIGTGAGVIFKGSGFYQTDYRSESYKKAAEAESKSTSDGSSGGDKASTGDGGAKSDGVKSDGTKSGGAAKSDDASSKSDGASKPTSDGGTKESKPSRRESRPKKQAN